MRGCSVLFVCALCVFVLCGAAAVVAQVVTPEKKAAEEAKGFAYTAKAKGDEALDNYTEFGNNLNVVIGDLTRGIDGIGASSIIADRLSLPGQVPSKEEIKQEIGKLETTATEAKNAVETLWAAYVASLGLKKEVLIKKMDEVRDKMMEAETAAAAVTDDDSTTIDAAIMRAGELKTAGEEASGLWNGAVNNLTTQLVNVDVAVRAVNTIKNDIESAKKKFSKNKSQHTRPLNNRLTNVVTLIVTPSLKTLSSLKSLLRNAKDAAEEAENKYTALAAAAEELKRKAEERKQNLQPAITPAVQPPGGTTTVLPSATTGGQTPPGPSAEQPLAKRPPTGGPPFAPVASSLPEETEDYSAGPLCSLTPPVFFFCCCVLFGM